MTFLQTNKVRNAGIILVSCICGWIMMGLEILGVRMLTPYFGSAIYVVTGSVIGVFLLSLSIGYMLGGWLSNKTDCRRMLGLINTVAGVWLCAQPFFNDPVCDTVFNFGLDEKWGSLLASLVLFGAPTILLGMVSPTVVHWLTSQACDSGFNAGMVLAASTVSSFAGCVITAFYLVLYSLRWTVCIFGVVLAVQGIVILLLAQRPAAVLPLSASKEK